MTGIRIISEEDGKIECICGYKAPREKRLRTGELGLEVISCFKCGGVTFKTAEIPVLKNINMEKR